ncbi:MAG: glycosyltransferase family 2 protein [Anaerolineae bacterium]|nr:glycosyltransferase family 2 protein [Anaerolineae bacterium]
MAAPLAGLSAVIVSWNVLPLLRECLDSLLPQLRPGDEALVVDNASQDGTEAAVATDYPQVQLIQAGSNLGFCGGVNLGLSRARGSLLLILNPDTRLAPGAVEAMRRLPERDASVAVVGPRLVDAEGSIQPSRRRFPTVGTLFVESTPAQRLPLLDRIPRRFRLEDRSDAHVQGVDWVGGACFLLRREALQEVGGLDGTFFMYSEEVDLCRRLGQLGWEAVFEPAAEVVHHEGKSSEQVPAARLVRFNRSKVLYAEKHFSRGVAEALRLYLLGTFAWEMGLEGIKLALGHRRDLRRERLGLYRQALASGLR